MPPFPLRPLVLALLGAAACTQPSTSSVSDDMSTPVDLAMATDRLNCNDSPLGPDGADDPFSPLQWHLKNSQSGGADLNLGSVWASNRGDRVLVGVVDDGLEIRHEDLAINTKASLGWNFWTGTAGFSSIQTDPTPTLEPGSIPPAHGTAVAGIIAARDKNGVGVTGIAPRACLSGINLIATGSVNALQTAVAMRHRMSELGVSNNSWGNPDGLGTADGVELEWLNAVSDGVRFGRGGRGVVYLFGAGNGANTLAGMATGFETDNSNLGGYPSNPEVAAICGVTDDGRRVHYSERGANLWVCGFAERTTYRTDSRGTVTTDLSSRQGYNARLPALGTGLTGSDFNNGHYTQIFNGTSAATPNVAGVVALLLKENPELGWRDLRLILAESARKNDPGNAEWQTNQGLRISGASGYNINHSYGFGLVDASAALALAKTWTNLPPQETLYESAVRTPGTSFADNSSVGVSDAIVVSGSTIRRIEAIEVILAATGDIGDLDVRLIGSAGTESRLAEPHNCYAKQGNTVPQLCGQQYMGWRMTTMRHLGENANQTWTLRISDRRAGRTSGGVLTAWQIKIHGRAS